MIPSSNIALQMAGARIRRTLEEDWKGWLEDMLWDAVDLGYHQMHSKQMSGDKQYHLFVHPQTGNELHIHHGPDEKDRTWMLKSKTGEVLDQSSGREADLFLDRLSGKKEPGILNPFKPVHGFPAPMGNRSGPPEYILNRMQTKSGEWSRKTKKTEGRHTPGDCQSCGASRRSTYIDRETGFCQDCLADILVDQHGNGHNPGDDDRCPKCREMKTGKIGERKDDDLHGHVQSLIQHGYKVDDYKRYSANRGHLAVGPRGRNRMDKGRDHENREQGFYTDPHLSLRLSGPKGKALVQMYKGRSKSTWQGPDKGFKHDFKTRDEVGTYLFGQKMRANIEGTKMVIPYGTNDPKELARKLKTMKPQESLSEAAPAQKKQPSAYDPPALPKSLRPSDLHGYYMSMADHHDKQAWKHKRLSGLKPLWSDDREMHTDRHAFHRAMRDGFAQKALAVDLGETESGSSKKSGFGESLQESLRRDLPRVSADTLTLEQFVERHGQSTLDALREGKIDWFVIVLDEAFSGTSPSGTMSTVNQNRPPKSPPPVTTQPARTAQPRAQSPFPSSPVKSTVRRPVTPTPSESVQRVAEGADPFEVLLGE